MSTFKNLAPPGFRKIAQNDDRNGDILTVVSYNNMTLEFFIQTLTVNDEYITLGPLPRHTFYNVCAILADVEGMDKKYYFLD